MRTLILSISSLLLLAIQVNAQQPQPQPVVAVNSHPTANVAANVVVSSEINVQINTKQSVDIQEAEPQKIKTFSKSFAVDKNDKIHLSNEYGAITIKTWDKNEIKVDAEIKAFANSAAEAQKLLDHATINASKTADAVSFITDIDLKNNWGFNSKKREVKVYMTVYMPVTNALSASQEYGNILMGDYSGATTLTVEYGALTTGSLKSSNNVIRVEYGSANIKSVNQAKINTEFGSGITIGSAGALTINAEYTNVKIGSVKGKTIANIEYSKLTAGDISDSFSVNAEYSTVSLGFNPSFKSSFSVATNYGSFKYGANISAKRQNAGNEDRYSTNKTYTGDIGKGDNKSGESVTIRSEYSDIIFK
ncbi:MAG: hypothetical protein V4663_06150 [Bacteroidota bacterium]